LTPVVDDGRLLEVFLNFARSATDPFDIDDILRDLALAAGRVLEITGAGVAYVVEGRMRFVHASTQRTTEVERVQEALQDGPCRDVQETGRSVVEPDLAANPDRWPGFVEHALEHGFRAVASVPLRARDRVWGALDLYRSETGGFDEREMAAARTLADVAVGYVVMAHDRDTALAAQQASAHAAHHDPLTGLPNRALLVDRLEHALATARRTGTAVGVLFLDLDGFKQINDVWGHHAGDQLLVHAAAQLSDIVRDGDTVARFGGDEFVVVCEGLPAGGDGAVPTQELETIADRVRVALARPTRIGDRETGLSASIGVAVGVDGADVDALLRAADHAMYQAKRQLPGS
jgi:diguanylate cyclase (GGDEF)-like protein